jgi:hypothetical protein
MGKVFAFRYFFLKDKLTFVINICQPKMSTSGLTRSTSAQSARNNLGSAGGASASQNSTPTNRPSQQQGPPTGVTTTTLMHHHQHHSTHRTAGGGGGINSSYYSSAGAAVNQHTSPPQQQQVFVSLDEFLQLKRQLERERSQREDAISQLREELYEMKEARRREKMDAAMNLNSFAALSAGVNDFGSKGVNRSSSPTSGTPTVPSTNNPQLFFQQHFAATSGSALDNSILGRLHRVEVYASSTLQSQLEALEERLRSKFDEKSRTASEFSRAESKKFNEKVENLAANVDTLKQDVTSRLPALEQKVSSVASLAQQNASKIEILQTHRIHDEEDKNRLAQDLRAIQDEVKAVEHSLGDKVEQARQRSLANNIDEAFVLNAIDTKLGKSQEEQKEYINTRLSVLETKIQDQQVSVRESIKTITDRIEIVDDRNSKTDQRCTQVEAQVLSKTDDGLRLLEGKVEAMIKDLNSANHLLLKDLNGRLEAQINDKVNCSRDEVEATFAQQIDDLADRLDIVTNQHRGSIDSQSGILQSLVNAIERSNAAAAQVLEGIDHYVQAHSSSNSNAASAVFASVREKIASCRQEEEGPTVGDALRILYQFERGQMASLGEITKEVNELRLNIGLVASGGVGGVNLQ